MKHGVDENSLDVHIRYSLCTLLLTICASFTYVFEEITLVFSTEDGEEFAYPRGGSRLEYLGSLGRSPPSMLDRCSNVVSQQVYWVYSGGGLLFVTMLPGRKRDIDLSGF